MLHKVLSVLVLLTATIFGAPVPTATGSQPGSQLIGEPFSGQVCFTNTGDAIGFGPQFEMVTPPGVTLNNAAFHSFAAITYQETCMASECNVTNPQTAQVRTIDANESFYILDYPIGSYSTTWPEQCIDLSFQLESSGANVQLGNPLDIQTYPLFVLGATAVDDGTSIYGAPHTMTVHPTVYTLEKSNGATEGEGATGPSYPITASLLIDVADGEDVNGLQVVDTLSGGMQFIALVSDDGCNASAPILPSTTSPGGTLSFDCGDMTGVLGTDRTITYTYYIPENDDTNTPILGPNGQWQTLMNQAEATADYNGSALTPSEANSTVVAKAITMHKTSSVTTDVAPSGFGPGDTVTYTLTMNISDYFEHNNTVVTDMLGDGQHFDTATAPTYTLSSGPSGNFSSANVHPCTAVDPVNGTCQIDFDLSDELGMTLASGTTISISFNAIIDTVYTVINNGNYITMGDSVSNTGTVQSNIPGVGTGIPDSSTDSNAVETEQLVKTIYAINGSTSISSPYKVLPGDTVTYRLKSVMPVKSFYDMTLTDYLPVPLFRATEITTGADTNTTPVAGRWDTGPDNNYDVSPTLSTDAGENTVTWTFADDHSNNVTTVLDILFTVTATNEPKADSLELANIAGTQYKDGAGDSFGSAGIINIETQEPVIKAENLKSIISSSNSNSSSITSVPDGFDSAMDNVDANDTITYQIHLVNTGHATAFDLNISDRFEQGGNVGQGLHSCTIVNTDTNGTGTGSGDLFAGIYSITQIEAGANFKINYECVVDQVANPGDDIDNTATLLSYASTAGGPNFVNKVLESKTKLELTGNMEIAKNIVASSIPDTNPDDNINQGEIVNFEINVTLGEGTYTNYALTDNTCTGPVLQSQSSNVIVSGTTVTVLGTGGSVDGTLSYGCETQAITSGTNTATVTADHLMDDLNASTSWTVTAPTVITSKDMSPAQADAGDTVTVTMDWTNDTSNPAYQCTITDPLNASVFDISTVAMTTTPAGYTCTLIGNEVQCVYTGDLTLPCPDGPAEFTVDVRDDVNTSGNLVNELTFTGVTLPSGHPGEGDSAINGSVESDANATLKLRSPSTPVKIFTATSENFTDPGDTSLGGTPDVAIGEVIDVNITYGFYEGTTLNVDLEDVFVDEVFTYVPGSMTISRSDSDLNVEDGVIMSLLAGVAAGVAVSVPDAKLAISATEITLSLGDVYNLNSSSATSTESFTLSFRVKVQNESSVQAGVLISDRGRVNFEDSISGDTRNAQSDIRSARTVEPMPTITKDVNQTSVRAGTELTYTLQICNDETNSGNFVTSGFDWSITDRIPDNILLSSGPTVNLNGTGAAVDTSASSGQDINATIDRLDKGECISIEYEAIVQQSAQFGEILTNTANFTTTSLPGNYGSAGNLSGLMTQEPGELNGERTGTGGVNDLFGSDSQSVTMNRGFIEKRVVEYQQYYAIGEEVHYQIDIGTPAGSAHNVIVNDILPVGLEFNASTVNYRVGNNLTVEFPSPMPVQNGQVVSFEFGDINASDLTGIIIDYNVTVANVLSNQDGISLQNDANVTFTDPNNPALVGVLSPAIPARQITIGEPNLEIQKSIIAGAVQAQADDTVSWQVVLSNDPANNAHTTAYAVDWEDVLPSHLADIQNYALSQAGADVNLTGQAVRLDSSHIIENNTTLSLPAFDLPVGSTVTITFDSIVQNDAVAGETQTNTTNASYLSLPGADGSLLGGRNSDDCGDDDDNSALNNYCESATADLIIDAGISIDKRIQGTQVNYTIGEELTYEMRISLIEGITNNVVLTDTLPAGLRYVSHAHQNGAPAMTYDFASADLNGGSGQDVIIDFGDVNNSADGNTTNDYIDVELTVLVENVAGNQNGDTPSNGDSADSSSVAVVSDANSSALTVPVPITIVEPDLNVTKSVTPDTQALGDIVTYTIRLSHSNLSTSDAWDINFTDTLDAGLEYISGSATGATVVQSGQVLTFGFAHLAQPDTRTVTYKARINDTVAVGTNLNNSLDTVYSGMPDANGTADGGRNGTDGVGGALNDYALQTSVPVLVNDDALTPVKSLTWSSDVNNDTVVSAGDILEYNLSVTNGLTYDVGEVNVTDVLDPNVTLMLDSIMVNGTAYGESSDTDWTVSGYWYTYASSDVDISYNSDTNYFEVYWQNVLSAGATLDISFDTKINDGNSTEVVFLDNTTIDLDAKTLVTAGTMIENIFTVDSNRTVPTDSNEVNATTDQRGIAVVPVKSLTATDQSFTDPGDSNLANTPPVAVGEVIDVELLFEFSGGTTRSVVLRDNFDLQHFVYVANSTMLESSSDRISVSDVDLNSSFAGANPISVDDSKIVHDANGFSLDIGDVFNNNYNAMDVTESLLLTFKLRVDNNDTVQAGTILNDHGAVSFSEYDPASNTSSVSELNSTEVGVVVVEPDVEISKTVTPTSARAGEQVTYTLNVCNDESNTTSYTTSAFDWSVTDVLPDELDLVGDPQYNGLSMFNGRDLDVTIDQIEPGLCVLLEYNATVNGAAQFEQDINNTARVESTSLPGVVPDERTGTGVSPNDLNSSSTATLSIDKPNIVKRVKNYKAYYPIGDTVEYEFIVGFTGSAKDTRINDQFPTGLKYVLNSARLTLPADVNVTYNPPLETVLANNEVEFVLGDFNVSSSGFFVLDVNATVEDILTNVDGTVLTNTADMTFTNPNTGAVETIDVLLHPSITLGEPELHISKSITTDLSVPKSAGDTISYEIVLTNSGTTTAYSVMWEDKVPVHTGEIHNPHLEVHAGTAYEANTTTPITDANFTISTVDEPDDHIVLVPFDLSPGATLVITFDTIIQPNVIPAETLVNSTSAATQSIPSGGRKSFVEVGVDGLISDRYITDANVSFTINQLPEAIDDCTPPFEVTHYGPNEGDLGSNDVLGDGTKEEHTWRVITQPSYGTVVINEDGTYIYTPFADYNNVSDSFTYEIEDSNGDRDQARVCIDVNCASSQTSDGGDALGVVSMLLLAMMTMMTGLYFVRREEERGNL